MIIDTHAHINLDQFEDSIDQILKEAKEKGVNQIIVVGMDDYHNQKAINLSKRYDNLYATVGIHPCNLENQDIKDVERLAKESKVVAIGETGIDLYWDKTNLLEQKENFIKNIELAIKVDKPIIIHTRNSFYEAYECIKPYKGLIKGVFHCLAATIKEAELVVDLGFYVGIGGIVTFKNAKDIHEIAKSINLENILVETDSPYLAPSPFRGSVNSPKNTYYVVEKIAELKGLSFEEVARVTYQNAVKLFKLKEE